ncbi:MAG: spore protease YyaC [Bacillota bacterium]
MYRSLLDYLKPPPVPVEMRFNINDAAAPESFARSFYSLLNSLRTYPAQPVVIMCIGTDRSTGDALGPLIGTRLKELGFTRASVYGTLDEPVHAANLTTFNELILSTHPHALIVAVDACLGRLDSVGHVLLERGPIKPGAGVNKTLPAVGDIAVTGIVNVGGFMEHFVLQNTRLSLVKNMAYMIAAGFARGFSLSD